MTRLLITGASGLLGLNLALAASSRAGRPNAGYQVTGLVHSHGLAGAPFAVRAVDLYCCDQVTNVLDETRPEIVINCAAVTNLDAVESNPAPAWRLNADLPGWLAKECTHREIRFVHISTDAIFDGLRGGYTEEDVPFPPNVYARSKLAGEAAVFEANPQAIVARVNFYGWSISGQRSLAEWFLTNLAAGRQIKGFTDIFFCPLLANHLAGLLLEMVEQHLAGLYHVVSRDGMSKYAFGQALARQFHLDESLISPASNLEAGLTARRSPNMTLCTDKLAAALGIALPDVASGIAQFYNLYTEGYPQRLRSFDKI
jgi:dTDP-4-dehydrorhamnose reductase